MNLLKKMIGSPRTGSYAVVLAVAQVIGRLRIFLVARTMGSEIQGQAMVLGLVSSFFATMFVLNTVMQLLQSDHVEDP